MKSKDEIVINILQLNGPSASIPKTDGKFSLGEFKKYKGRIDLDLGILMEDTVRTFKEFTPHM